MSDKREYTVLSPLRRNGKDYQPGESVELEPDTASTLRLVAIKVVKVKPAAVVPIKTPETPPKSEQKPEGDALRAAIREAAASLDKADKALWMADGKTPQVTAIEAVLGYGITAAERDEVLKG